MEMVYCTLYHFVRAAHRGEADVLIAFLVSDDKLFGLTKRKKTCHTDSLLSALDR
jgi:hypothetical protein